MWLRPQTPEAMAPLLQPRRYKGLKGGRGGAKSHFFAGYLVADTTRQHIRAACLREVQKTIKESVKQTIEDKIDLLGVRPRFRITDKEIVYPKTDSVYIFRGLQNHTATSIKSLEGYNRGLYEEAQSLSKRSLEIATPTFRIAGSEQWFAWNPDLDTDPVDKFFSNNEGDQDFICRHVNYYDNPWFPDDLRRDMERDRKRDSDKYEHVWLGGYRRNSDAQVFKNWRVEYFDTPRSARLLLGADWGFSVDPTVLVSMFIDGRTLFIDREVYGVGINIDETPRFFDTIDPDWTPQRVYDRSWKSIARKLQITADSSRPDTISYMQRHGFPNMRAAVKGPGSLEDGVEFLKSFDIVVHPRCTHVRQELRLYSYETDKKTGEVLARLQDKKNHTIDSVRYAIESVRHNSTTTQEELRI